MKLKTKKMKCVKPTKTLTKGRVYTIKSDGDYVWLYNDYNKLIQVRSDRFKRRTWLSNLINRLESSEYSF